MKSTRCVFLTSNLSLPLSPPLTDTLLLVPGAPWILVNHSWWLSDWHSLNETHSHSSVTLSSHLHLNLFLWSCQLFFFLFHTSKDFQAEHQRDLILGLGAILNHHHFLSSERKAQNTFYVSFEESARSRRTEGFKNGEKKGRKDGKNGQKEGKEEEKLWIFIF